MNKKNIKISLTLFLVFIVLSCSSHRERKIKEKLNHQAYKDYLISRNIDSTKANDLDYYDDFFDFKMEKKRIALLNDQYLKTNKVYMYEGQNIIAFCIFADDGSEYIARVNKNSEAYLTAPNNKIISIKQKIKLDFLGDFILQDSIIKISRNERRAWDGKEWNECDVGYIKEGNIYLRENYIRKYSHIRKNG